MLTREEIMQDYMAKKALHDAVSAYMREPVFFSSIAALQELREEVLAINRKRRPRWRFRQESSMVLQLQPQADERNPRRLFSGMALQGEGIERIDFKNNNHAGKGLASIYLHIDVKDGRLEMVHGGHSMRSMEEISAFKARVVALLQALEHFNVGLLFQPYCLVCDKQLTDLISMARGIGPECAQHFGLGSGIYARLFNVN
jgi:hypothetical protein